MTILEAVEEMNETMKIAKYAESRNLIRNLLENDFIKTVAIHGVVTEFGYHHIQSVVAVNSDAPDGRHAEELLFYNMSYEKLHEEHHFIMTSRIPCERCMRLILSKPYKKLNLLIPTVLDASSKWFYTQVKAIQFMHDHIRHEEDVDLEDIVVIYYD